MAPQMAIAPKTVMLTNVASMESIESSLVTLVLHLHGHSGLLLDDVGSRLV